jgi:hypothetical protein
MMNKTIFSITTISVLLVSVINGQHKSGNPEDNLPSNITRITQFGERADFSHNGKKILFVEKTYGDVYEVELATGKISLITGHFYHGGFTRALYLANGDVLLSGCTNFDAANPHVNRQTKAELWILDRSYAKPPFRLGTKCSEGPAVSRRHMKIAWTVAHTQYPDSLTNGQYLFYMASIVYINGIPELSDKKIILDNSKTGFRDMEVQNFVPPSENALTFAAYGYQGTEVMLLNLETGAIKNLSDADNEYDEPEGIFPDGKYTCVESNRQNTNCPGCIDVWKLNLNGSGQMERLTFFSDYDGYKSSNPVISDDGRFMAFQMARSTDLAGIGYGIFIMELKK